jgi:RNA polymerase subunit RPABC4/transcription elongation factor Spt4
MTERQPIPDDGKTYMACLHCDWLVPEGESHYCEACGWNHTPEATWMEGD